MRLSHRFPSALMALLTLTTVGGLALAAAQPGGDQKTTPAKKVALSPAAAIPTEQWQQASTKPLKPGEIDQILFQELKKHGIKPAPLTSDEQFLRRVYLDLTGTLPMPADITDFLKDKNPNKRAKLIDQFLEKDEFANHWANYWHSVIASRVTDPILLFAGEQFKPWMAEQLKSNKNWAEITQSMLTVLGELRFFGKDAEAKSYGAGFLLGSRRGTDAATERTAEVSRIFLGIQIQCAQCHDHPSDVWKRQQFHELAAYFVRLKERPIFEEKRVVGYQLVSAPFAEYQMPGKTDPKKTSLTHPKFLDGKAAGAKLTDLQRRQSLAESITSKNNPWFAAAFVNRLWGELLGQSFYQPVDDLGPQKEAVFPPVLTRLAGAFKGSNYDLKGLFRAIMNTQAYQRQIRVGETPDEHLLFAAVYPKRLQGDALWHSLVCTLGPIGPLGPQGFGGKPMPLAFAARFGLEGTFKQEFSYDPSTKAEDIESSVAQALLLMNNPQVNNKMRALGTNLLARILKAYPKDNEALTILYQRALARTPTARELERCQSYVTRVGHRAEAFEDILWVLINSTEFQTKR